MMRSVHVLGVKMGESWQPGSRIADMADIVRTARLGVDQLGMISTRGGAIPDRECSQVRRHYCIIHVTKR